MPDKFAFVLEDGSGRPSREDMTRVRSHSMRGRNVRIDSRRSKRREKQQKNRMAVAEEQVIVRAPASDLACVHFATTVDDRSRQILFKILAISATSNLLYPVERCIDLHKVEDYVRWLSQDAGFVHITLFTTCAIDDFALHQQPTALTVQYLNKALSYVNKKLSETEGYKADTILIIVMTLAFVATMFQDLDAVSAHIGGLRQLVQLRGGRQYLISNPKTYFKIERIELSWCLSTGCKPMFFSSPVSWEPYFRGSQPVPFALADSMSIDIATWPKLAGIYKDLQCLANLINDNEEQGTKMDAHLFQNAVHSLQSRLLALQGELGSGIAECLRLGMLAALTTTFRLPTRKMPHAHLASQLRIILKSTRATTPGMRIMLTWVFFMSVIAVFDVTEPWISQSWHTLVGEKSWDTMRSILKRLVWIRCIHDEPGQKIFMQLGQLSRVSM
ncbi:hypothetical protein BS50DRAFT_622392 [Corynespora cassiicola Philippines]|uniref:Transcription factor domain-containing protein n=1 Tax=Corynespora cassiicola Philippines TaxID=1448308 RepID=A0A2T2NI99_CORCC|nr:hypothetical protein BS50DRAFT_622392 [Corynespora cassiicola Philippines]